MLCYCHLFCSHMFFGFNECGKLNEVTNPKNHNPHVLQPLLQMDQGPPSKAV